MNLHPGGNAYCSPEQQQQMQEQWQQYYQQQGYVPQYPQSGFPVYQQHVNPNESARRWQQAPSYSSNGYYNAYAYAPYDMPAQYSNEEYFGYNEGRGSAPVARENLHIEVSHSARQSTNAGAFKAASVKQNSSLSSAAGKDKPEQKPSMDASETKDKGTDSGPVPSNADDSWDASNASDTRTATVPSKTTDQPNTAAKEGIFAGAAKVPGKVTEEHLDGKDAACKRGSVASVEIEDEEEQDVTFTEEAVVKLLKKGLREPDARPHLNVVFIGHVDAGKSTTCGNILFLTGQVDNRTIEKYEREAKEKNRDTWYYAYVMDINEDERIKGKTVEVGRAAFELPGVRYTILDAPGHKGFVPEMLAGAAQADVGVLIISARKGEFEAGFERGGQTREHALLAKTLGVNQLIVAVNKMDEPTCDWSQTRYDEICKKLLPFLKSCGFNPAKDLHFLPMAGLSGHNIQEHVSDPSSKLYQPKSSWYTRDKPTLFELLCAIEPPKRDTQQPLRIPLLAGHKDNGVVAVGKVESGVAMVDQPAILMPNRVKVKIVGVRTNEEDYAYAKPGENVELRLLGVDEDVIKKGCVLSSIKQRCPAANLIEAQIVIVELLEHRPILTAGYKCVLHAHTACEEIELEKLIYAISKSTKKRQKQPAFVKTDMVVTCLLRLSQSMCLEPFGVRPQLGRFTLRDEGKTIAIGKVLAIIE